MAFLGLFLKIGILIILIFIVSMITVIVSGRILGQINKSSSECQDDKNIDNAHDLAAIIVTLASFSAAFCIVCFGMLFIV